MKPPKAAVFTLEDGRDFIRWMTDFVVYGMTITLKDEDVLFDR